MSRWEWKRISFYYYCYYYLSLWCSKLILFDLLLKGWILSEVGSIYLSLRAAMDYVLQYKYSYIFSCDITYIPKFKVEILLSKIKWLKMLVKEKEGTKWWVFSKRRPRSPKETWRPTGPLENAMKLMWHIDNQHSKLW